MFAVETLIEKGMWMRGDPLEEARIKGAFTRYVAALGPCEEPSADAFGAVWHALRAALAHELRKRSLWSSPPSYLGVYGWRSWTTRGRGARRMENALEELVADCYAAVFVRRLARLRAHLEIKDDIEGLVFLLIRNFLHDRQKRHDPLGFRVYQVLRIAVREAVDAGELAVLAGDAAIRNPTLLGVAAASVREPVTAALRPLVERWNAELLPDLVTAAGPARRPLVARLRRRLLDLEAEGVRTFRFKDLADAFKDDVRLRWAALFDLEEGEAAPDDADATFAATVRLFHPTDRLAERDAFEKLVSCTTERLERLETTAATRHYLRTLWGFLRSYARGEGPDKLPSNRKLAALLRIPRERFPRLYETLSRLIGRCGSGSHGRAA